MNLDNMPALRIGALEAKIPIIQGGMGVGISLSNLASAVANAGGIGVIATPGIGQFESDYDTNPREANKRALGKEIRKARAQIKPGGLLGVNAMVALSNFDDLVQCAVDEGANMLFLGAGLPLALPETLPLDKLDELPTKFAPIVSSGRAAKLVFRAWKKRYNYAPDAVIVEGPLAGGHLGFRKEQIFDPDYTLEKILPDVIAVVKSYEEAQGVQMATRFVATHECDAAIEFKEAYLNCKKDDVIIIDSPVGLPGRVIKGKFFDRISAGVKETFKCSWKCLRSCNFRKAPYCIAQALTNAKTGNLDGGFAFAGANAYRLDKIISVPELIETLKQEYKAAVMQRT